MEILLLFSVVAFLYASVGHGGASGYIALMAIFAFPQSEIKSNALFLNLFVSFISFTQFFKKEEFPFKLFFMLIVFSIPMAFLGGMWTLDNKWYKIILGLILFIPIVKFLGFFPKMQFQVKQNLLLVIVLGLLIGGIVTAPFSARLTSKIPSKYMFIAVGVLVMTLSIFSIVKTILSF